MEVEFNPHLTLLLFIDLLAFAQKVFGVPLSSWSDGDGIPDHALLVDDYGGPVRDAFIREVGTVFFRHGPLRMKISKKGE